MHLLGKTRSLFLAAIVCLSLVPVGSGWELQAPRKPHKKQTPAKPLPQLPAGPLQPITLDQMPSSPPQVSYQAGQLTISARNCTLGDILRAVRAKTGANFDVPAGATERVMGQLGPGPPRDVIASLLNGSRFDYVMLGSATNPAAIDQLILTPKAGTPAGGAPPAVVNDPGQPQPGQPAFQAGGDAERGDADAEATVDDSSQAQPDSAEQGDQADAQEGPQDASQPNSQQVKTPEQLLQELQQQQQQLQQQQGAPAPPPPGQPPNQPEE
jgi:hypothetical protein